jgi:drug/metabolite transporter (DMT)-like permease
MVENHPDIRKQEYRGIACLVLSAFCFALMSMFVHLAGDLPSMQKSFFRNLVAALSAVVLLLRAGEPFRIRRENLPYFLMRSIFGTMGVLCNFYAVDHLVLADASILNKMSPFFTVLFSWLILKEKVMPIQLSLIFGAFLGSIFVVKPTFSNLALVPSLLGFFGGICAGAAYTMVRKLGEAGEKGPVIVLFFSVFSCVVVLPWLIFDYHPMSLAQIGILLFAGLSAAGGQFSITAAYCYAPAREISVYDYSQIIFSAGLGFFFFEQIPDLLSWIGYAVICLMAVAMFLYNNRRTE